MDKQSQFLQQLKVNATFKAKAINRELGDLKKIKKAKTEDLLRTTGFVLYYSDKYSEAIKYLNASVAIKPTERTLVKLAQSQIGLKNFRDAFQTSSKVKTDFPKNKLGYLLNITALIGLERFEEAYELGTKVSKRLKDKRIDALTLFARYKTQRNDIKILQKIKKTSPLFYDILISVIREFDPNDSAAVTPEISQDEGIIIICGAEQAN